MWSSFCTFRLGSRGPLEPCCPGKASGRSTRGKVCLKDGLFWVTALTCLPGKRQWSWVRERPSRIQTQICLTRLLPGPWNRYPLALPVTKATFCPDRASNSRAGVEIFFLVSFFSFWMTSSPERSRRTGVPPLLPGAGTMAQ